MSPPTPIPIDIIRLVQDYVQAERHAVNEYDNREYLDHSGLYDLYRLAQEIYASGWVDGGSATREMAREPWS